MLQSIQLLADASVNFSNKCIAGIQANEERISYLLNQSLMLVTALNTHIGCDNAAKIAKYAYDKNTTLNEAAIALGLLDGQTFDEVIRPENMFSPK